jgi:prefoldin subunit 5
MSTASLSAAQVYALNQQLIEYQDVREVLSWLPKEKHPEIVVKLNRVAFFQGHLERTDRVVVSLGADMCVEQPTHSAQKSIERRIDDVTSTLTNQIIMSAAESSSAAPASSSSCSDDNVADAPLAEIHEDLPSVNDRIPHALPADEYQRALAEAEEKARKLAATVVPDVEQQKHMSDAERRMAELMRLEELGVEEEPVAPVQLMPADQEMPPPVAASSSSSSSGDLVLQNDVVELVAEQDPLASPAIEEPFYRSADAPRKSHFRQQMEERRKRQQQQQQRFN